MAAGFPPPMEYKNLIEGGLFPSPPKLKELKEKKLNSKGVKEVIGRSTKEGRALPLTHSLTQEFGYQLAGTTTGFDQNDSI